MKRKLKTATHVINVFNKACPIKHTIKIYEDGDDLIIDVIPNAFLDRKEHANTLKQVIAQMYIPLWAKGQGLKYMNVFSYDVVVDDHKAFIRVRITTESVKDFMKREREMNGRDEL
jgi:hypothetical protein